MSDSCIALIPLDPLFLPQVEAIRAAADRFAAIAPEAGRIEIRSSDHIQFFDCGANLERICCPSCGSELDTEWWQERMDEDCGDEGFQLRDYRMPCCNHESSLNDLRYDWPQGFARFGIDAMNPNIGELTDEQVREVELLLKTPLRVIYQHL
jgi:hypothetical protein